MAAQRRLEEAIVAFRAAIEDRPGEPGAHHGLGNALVAQGNLLEAITESRAAIHESEYDPEAHFALGRTRRALKKPEEAVAHSSRARNNDPICSELAQAIERALAEIGRETSSLLGCRDSVRLEARSMMGLLYRVLGLTALVREFCQSIHLHHIIRLDWILMGLLLFYLLAGASALGLPWPAFTIDIQSTHPVLQTTLASSALVLFLICWVRQDTIFRPIDVNARGGRSPQSAVSESPQPIDLRLTGRFDRGFGQPLMLREIPVRWNVDDTGAILLEAYIDEIHIGAGYPIPCQDNSGPWSLIIAREALIGGAEEGLLYFGFTARPAFRLRLPARKTTAILSVRNLPQMIRLRHTFDEIVTESTAKEANFFRDKLAATLSESSSPPSESAQREVKPGEEIRWNDLIDFSQ
jgi:hypothetical protein